MNEKYNQPSGKEVAVEVLRNIGNDLKKIGLTCLAVNSLFTVGPYILPSIRRIWDGDRDSCKTLSEYFEKEKTKTCEDRDNERGNYIQGIGIPLGLITGFALDFVQAYGYIYAVNHDHPEVLAIPVVTNVASLLYEKSRKAREKLFLNRNVKTLDDVVEQSKK